VTHELKIWPEHFQAVVEGKKRAELRGMDRDFKVGDRLVLREWVAGQEPKGDGDDGYRSGYTGRDGTVVITHIHTGLGMAEGYAMLSFGHCYGEAARDDYIDGSGIVRGQVPWSADLQDKGAKL
jgi:hypothetical protein